MIPAFNDHPEDSLIPELRALAFHDRAPTAPVVQATTPERTSHFRIYVKRVLECGFYHNVEDGIRGHVEAFKFLNTVELEAISVAINTLEDEIHDIGANLVQSQDAIAYTQMLLRSRDSEITPHRKLYKRQLKISRRQNKHFMRSFDCFHKHIAHLRAIYSEETKRTCDFEDSQAATTAAPEST
ncbi:hypothetical protein DFH28DRAFT_1078523 [Melampsora americana]|nr:hypothetical protein DFH28DRAFT_1079549 [Melampsora americana]KAH9822223.1 hypothetical protein DFH28DRAFT_1078523 [Melampsora americana]